MLKHMYVPPGIANHSLNMSSGSAARSPQHSSLGNHVGLPNGKMNGNVMTGRGTPGHALSNIPNGRQPVLHPLLNTSKASYNSSSISPGGGLAQQNVTKTTMTTVDHGSVDYGTTPTVTRVPQQNLHVHKHSSPLGPWHGPPPVPASHPPSPLGGLRYRNLMSNYLFPRGSSGVTELLLALGLLCVISLILGLLALTFLLRLSPTSHDVGDLHRGPGTVFLTGANDLVIIHEVAVGLTALTLSLDLCCLLVCSAQFLFALKLLKVSSQGQRRIGKYLRESAKSRVCAIAGFFLSVPSFLAAVILYSVLQFHSRSAIVTSILLGLGILFCGVAMIHNVYVWQKVGHDKETPVRTPSPTPLRKKDISGPLENSRLDGTPHANGGGHHNKSLTHPFEISAISSTHAHELSTLV